MDFFFNPRAIALVGASATPGKGGHSILYSLSRGFKGPIYPINPRYPSIEGLTCYPSIHAAPEPIDLAIVFVPAANVPAVLEQCAACGIAGVMVQSGGFAESPGQGPALQEKIVAICRRSGMRLWGPNCMGLVDAVHRHVFSFVTQTIWDVGPLPGKVSLIVQSGMLSAGFLIDMISHGKMGISKACSIGNKADVDECDVLEYLLADPHTGAIGLYLESIADGRRFHKLCQEAAKPIVVLKGGKSPMGRQAAMSHTASLAGDRAVVSGALAQAGVIEAVDFKQMMDLCRTLAMFPQAKGSGRIAVATFSGGAGIVATDFIESLGLTIAELSPATVQALEKLFPAWMPVNNPVDLWPAVELHGGAKVFGTAIAAALADPAVDAVFCHFFLGGFAMDPDVTGLARLAAAADKPLFCWLIGKNDMVPGFYRQAHDHHIAVFAEIQRAVTCMAAVFARARRIAGHQCPPGPPPEKSDTAGADILPPEKGAIDEHRAKQVLARIGVPVVAEKVAATAGEAVAAARTLGFPLVIKGLTPGLVHKTEAGLVRTGIIDPEGVRAACADLRTAMGADGQILVQQQVQGDFELMAGLVRDPQFGPCVMVGMGGVMAEIWQDKAFAVAPLILTQALELIGRLKNQRLLDGFRAFAPLDRPALAAILLALGDLALNFPRIQAIDINPLIICMGKPVAVDATLVLQDGRSVVTPGGSAVVASI